MRKTYGVILAIIGYIVFFFCMEGWGADWKHFGANGEESLFYDAETFQNIRDGIIRVWVKAARQDELLEIVKKKASDEAFMNIVHKKMDTIDERQSEFEKQNIKNAFGLAYAEIMMETAVDYVKAHKKILYEFKRREKQFRIIRLIVYNEKEEATTSFSNDEENWRYIVPETFIAILFKELCK